MTFPRLFALAALLVAVPASPARAIFDGFGLCDRGKLDRLNRTLAGHVCDFTDNHGRDNRIYSPALGQWRSVYVYVPPGYDGRTRFPAMLWLHGMAQTEKNFLGLAGVLDEAIRAGACPPVVIVAPDGSVRNRPSIQNRGSFFINSKAGNFEDYIVRDVWCWARAAFAIRPEREAHLIAGGSMGGFGAYNLAFKYKGEFGLVAGILPALDTRYVDCHGSKFGPYDPDCIARRTEYHRRDVMGSLGGIPVRQRRMLGPLFGLFGRADVDFIAANNPVEMLAAYDVRPGDYEMFIAYPTEDEFNIDAQVLHFVDVANRRGIHPEVLRMDGLHHTMKDGMKAFPTLSRWMTVRLAPYGPGGIAPAGCGAWAAPNGVARPMYLSPLPASPGTLALR